MWSIVFAGHASSYSCSVFWEELWFLEHVDDPFFAISCIPRFVSSILKTLQFLKLFWKEEENDFPRSVSRAGGSSGKEIGEFWYSLWNSVGKIKPSYSWYFHLIQWHCFLWRNRKFIIQTLGRRVKWPGFGDKRQFAAGQLPPLLSNKRGFKWKHHRLDAASVPKEGYLF